MTADSSSQDPIGGWGWWRPPLFMLGLAALGAALGSPLERLGQRDLLTAHFAQHIMLADLAAPLLLVGSPPFVRRRLRAWLARLAASSRTGARGLTWALSPIGAFLIWVAATYFWVVPPIHRAAVPGGVVHSLDHVSFLLFGLLIWLAAFDPRVEQDLGPGLRLGGLAWWARHTYAMSTRVAMLPPAIAVWVASGGVYHTGAPRPAGISIAEDQEGAASLWIGFEMMLFSLAFLLAFIFAQVAEGRRRTREQQR